MNFFYRIETKALEKLIGKMESDARKIMIQVSSESIFIMRKRITAGLNISDATMPAYSASYRREKAKAGRQVSVRDLTFTGRLLGDISILSLKKTGTKWQAIIGFASARGRFLALNHQARHRFFGFSPKNKEQIARLFQTKLQALLRKK